MGPGGASLHVLATKTLNWLVCFNHMWLDLGRSSLLVHGRGGYLPVSSQSCRVNFVSPFQLRQSRKRQGQEHNYHV